MSEIKTILKILVVPLILLAVYLTMALIWNLADLPKDEELVSTVKTWFDHYGLWIVLVSAILEGTLLLGQYYPGGIVIFLGVITAGNNIPRVVEVVTVVSIAFFIGYTIDYLVGKYGWYKLFLRFGLAKSLENAQTKLQRHQFNAIILSYWEPNLASITATAAGVLHLPFRKFSYLSAFGIVVWNIFWGTLVHLLGYRALEAMGLKWVLVIFCSWVAIILGKYYFFDRKKNSHEALKQ